MSFRESINRWPVEAVLAAHADAKRQLDATQESIMREAMGPLAGLKIPGL